MPRVLPQQFYNRDTLTVARELLGQLLVRDLEEQQLSGQIVEVEAYVGESDTASHASPGPTDRNAPMYGPPGHAYVYLIYGIHHCLNVVTEPSGFPAAILIRAIAPLEGLRTMRQLRGSQHPDRNLTRGPGRLCQALDVDLRFDGSTLYSAERPLRIEEGQSIPDGKVARSPRIGVRGDEAALTARWRFYVRDNRWVSGKTSFNEQF